MTATRLIAQADWLTPARVRRFAVMFAAAAILLVTADSWMHTRAGLTDVSGVQLGRDFVNYWSGAHLAADGHGARVYDLQSFVAYQRVHTTPQAQFKWYSYPPPALLLTLPLALTGFVAGLVLWLAAGGLIVAALLKRDLGWGWALAAAFATPASLMNILSGQNGFYSAALLAGGILALGRRPWLAGMLFGALCFKPHLALMVPVALIAGGYWRTLLAAALSALALLGASYLAFGPEAWSGFLANAPLNVAVLEKGLGFWERMPTAFAAVRLAGGGIALAYGAQIASALAAAVATIAVWRSGAAPRIKGAALVFASILATPYAWDYDLIAASFAVAWLVTEARTHGFAPYEKFVLGLVIGLPLLVMPVQVLAPLQTGALMLWAALIVTAHKALVLGRAPSPC